MAFEPVVEYGHYLRSGTERGGSIDRIGNAKLLSNLC